MSDDTAKLQHAVSELHEALAQTTGLSDESRAMLTRALDDVRAALANAQAQELPVAGQPAAEGDLSLSEQLAEVAAEFEGDHPTLGGTLRSVIDALAQIGI